MKDLSEYLDSEEGQKDMEKYVEKLAKDLAHNDRWVERMWERIKEDIDGSIEHMLKWYESDRYRDREYGMGFQPREELLWVLFGVAEIHGEECTEEEIDIYANMFTSGIFKLGSYVIQIMNGQGSIIGIDKIK